MALTQELGAAGSALPHSLHHLHDAEHVDLVAFQRDVRTARKAQQGGELDEASKLLYTATARWAGPLLAGLPALDAARTRLSEVCWDAVDARFEIDLELGPRSSPPHDGG